MKLIVTILFAYFTLISSLYAQSAIEYALKAIDSVDHNKQSTKILIDSAIMCSTRTSNERAYINYAQGLLLYSQDNLDSALNILNSSYHLAIEIQNQKLACDIAIHKINILTDQQKYDEAFDQLKIIQENSLIKNNLLYNCKFNRAYGNTYIENNDFENGYLHYLAAANLDSILLDSLNYIKDHYNAAFCLFYLGRFDEAYILNNNALKIAEKIKNENYAAICLNNIGAIHERQNNLEKAITYYKKACSKYKTQQNNRLYARSLGNIGNILKELGQYSEALTYHKKALLINTELNNTKETAKTLSDIGDVMLNKESYEQAKYYFEKALILCKQSDYTIGVAINNYSLGLTNSALNELNKSIEYFNTCLNVLSKIKDHHLEMKAYEELAKVYQNKGQFNKAYSNLLKMNSLKDEMFSEKSNDKITELESKYQLEQKNKQIASQNERLILNDALIKKNTILKLLYSFITLIFIALTIIVSWALRKNRKANKTISSSNTLLQQQQQLLSKSINYAEKIQKALLPTKKELDKLYSSYFLINEPKDVVSGDFIWTKKFKNKTLLAIADCTGHGVPGGFMSMLGMSFLNELILKENLPPTGEILDTMRDFIKSSLRQTGSIGEAKDGINISLCIFNDDFSAMEYTSALQPILLHRKNVLSALIEDKQPVGVHLKEKAFATQNIPLEANDELYFFTDGITDQLNSNNKRYTNQRFKQSLISNTNLNNKDKRRNILEACYQWRGTAEQTDDILLFNLKI